MSDFMRKYEAEYLAEHDHEVEFEVVFEKTNKLSGRMEVNYDHVHASSRKQAISEICWKHGDLLDIISAKVLPFQGI